MKLSSALLGAAALVIGLGGGSVAYQLATTAGAPASSGTSVTTDQAQVAARVQPGTRFGWAPCKPPAVQRGKACVTDVVRTVTVPGSSGSSSGPASGPASAPAAPAPRAPVAPTVSIGEHEAYQDDDGSDEWDDSYEDDYDDDPFTDTGTHASLDTGTHGSLDTGTHGSLDTGTHGSDDD